METCTLCYICVNFVHHLRHLYYPMRNRTIISLSLVDNEFMLRMTTAAFLKSIERTGAQHNYDLAAQLFPNGISGTPVSFYELQVH